MSFEWIHDNPPHWDQRKAEIVGGAPPGVFEGHDDDRLLRRVELDEAR